MLGINSTKEVQSLYSDNYKTFLKDIKDINKWKDPMLMDQKT